MRLFSAVVEAGCRLCSWLACLALFAIGALICAQVVARMFGMMVPSAIDFAAFAMAAVTFLGLAPTFRADGHIRVLLAIDHLPGRLRQVAEGANLLLALLLLGYVAWKTGQMALVSYEFGDTSMGIIPTPLWIPQTALFLGSGMATVAVFEELLLLVTGGRTRFTGEHAVHEHHEV